MLAEDESSRLSALRELDILDTAAEETFDALVRTAAMVCQVPISLISLIDERRQWFKANIGLRQTGETPREHAFCAHTIQQDQLLEVPDARLDPRFRDNPLVLEPPGVRFYAGAPIVLSGGARIGALCVIAHEPRTLEPQQRELLGQLAQVAAHALEGRRARRLESELQQARLRSDAALGQIFSLSRDGFAALDEQACIIYCSPRFKTLLEPLIGDCAGLPLLDLLSRLNEHPALRGSVPGLPAMEEHPLRWAFDTPRFQVLELGLQTDTNGDGGGMLQLRDVTEQYELDRLKREFLASAAHELRTPMTSIYGYAELLLNRELEPDRRQHYLARIHRQCDLLMNITSELMELSQLEARMGQDFQMQELALDEIVRESVEDFKVPDGRQMPLLELADEHSSSVRADRQKLRQVLLNLLSNAYKYSPDGGAVTVRLLARPQARELLLEVQDEGMGMTPEQLARVCERFYRANPTGSIPGSGLGMSIVQEIIRLSGGRLSLRSEPGLGTCVSVHLPMA